MRKLFHPGRPAGRLFYCLISVLVAVGVSRGAPPPTPPATTTISDVIYRADGSTAAGTLLITWPAFSTSDNRAVPAGSMSLAIGPFGAINLALVPNQGATPAGTYYKVVLKLNDGTTSEEFWVVPTLSPTTISAIRSQVVPAGVALQVVTRQYVDGQLATKADSAVVVHRTGDESVDGVKSFSASPTVPTPTTDAAAANKGYVDAAAASVNPNNYVLKSGDTMTGALNTPGLASARVNGIRYADQFANIQAAVTDAGTTGAVVISPSYAGTDTFTNPNGISILDLRKSAINVANVKAWGAKGDGRAVTRVVTNGGNTTITDTTDAPWTSGDMGKTIVLYGSSFSPGLVTTISSFTDSSHIVLAAAPQQGISGVTAVWGSDDTAAINAAAATITAKGNIGTLYFPQGLYLSSASLHFANAQGLTITGDGPGSSVSLGNWNAGAQPATGSSVVWIGGQGGVIGCTGNTGSPPSGVAGATQNCTAAENYQLQVSGQFILEDINFQGSQRVSHNVIVGGGDTSTSFNWSINRLFGGYARQYGLVIGGTNADQPGNFGESYLENIALGGNGLPNTTVAESDPTGGGDVFIRFGAGNFQKQWNTGYLGIGGSNGNHHIFQYSGNYLTLNNVYFAPLTANGGIHSSIYVLSGIHHTYDNLYDENGYLLHIAGGDDFDLRQVQMRQQTTTNPHAAIVADTSVALSMNGVFTQGLPVILNSGGRINQQQVEVGSIGTGNAYSVNNCSGGGCITRSGSTVTVQTASAHGFRQNDWIQVNGAADATYNGVFQVASVADSTHFAYVDSLATGVSTQGGTTALGCCVIASTTANLNASAGNPFLSYLSPWNQFGSNADAFSAAITNLASKNLFVYVPVSAPGTVGSSMPATIPAGSHFLDFRGGNPTYLGGPFQWGTSLNFTRLGINTADLRTPSATLDVNSPSGTPAATFHSNGSDEYSVVFNTDSGATARLLSRNNGAAFWEIDFFHGANKQFAIQSQTKAFFIASDTNNTTSLGSNTSTVNTVNGTLALVEQAAPTGIGSNDLLWADSTAHRLKVNNNNGGATTLAQFADKLSVFASTSSSELAGVISDETGSGSLVFANSPILTTPNIGNATGSISGNAGTATAMAADPADCTGNNFALGINASGVAQCAQPAFSNLSGTAASGQLPATVVYSNQGNTYSAGAQDFESAAVTRPFRRLAFASFPGTCTANREFLERSDPATAGQVLYVCNSAGNGWDLVGDGGSGGGGSPYASGGGTANLVPKSNGAALLVDSGITDNGATVSSTEFAKFGPASGSFDANSGSTIDAGKHSIATLNPAVAGAGLGQTVVTQDNNTNNIFSQYVLVESNHTAGTRTRARSLEADVYASGSGGTTTNADAITGYAEQDSGATVGSLRALNTTVQVNSGATAVNTALIGLDIGSINLDAAITVPLTQGVRIFGATKTAGTITTSIGLDILDQTAGATNYAIRTGAGQVAFGDTTSAPIVNASTGYRVAGGAASGNVLRGNGTNFVGAALACADVTNCASLVASGTAGVGPSKAGTASTAARSDHDHRSFHTLTWYFPGTPSTGVSPMILAVPQGIVNGTITGMQVTVATTSASSSTFNLQRCTANCTGTSPTFSNIYSSDNTLSANTSEADFGTTNLTTTLNAKDQFKANLVTIGSGLANVTITLTYKYDTTN